MDAERYAKLEALFQQARRLNLRDREPFLVEQCKEDVSLKAEVERLLRLDEEAKGRPTYLVRPRRIAAGVPS